MTSIGYLNMTIFYLNFIFWNHSGVQTWVSLQEFFLDMWIFKWSFWSCWNIVVPQSSGKLALFPPELKMIEGKDTFTVLGRKEVMAHSFSDRRTDMYNHSHAYNQI